MKANLLLFCIMIIIFGSFVSAVKDTQTNIYENTNIGLTVVHPQFLYFPQTSQINLSFDVLDSNFSRLDDTEVDCLFYMVDNYGSRIESGGLNYADHWYYNFTSSDVGEYAFYVYCNSSENQGGFVSDNIFITDNGREESIIPLYSLIILIGLLIVFYLYIIKNFNVDLFEENGALKIFFIALSFWLTLIPFYAFILFNSRYGISGISDLLNSLWPYIIWINVGLTIYLGLYLVIKMLKSISLK